MPAPRQETVCPQHVPQLLPPKRKDQDGLQMHAHSATSLFQWPLPKLLLSSILLEEKVKVK